jgi:hypothetical protein
MAWDVAKTKVRDEANASASLKLAESAGRRLLRVEIPPRRAVFTIRQQD